MNYPIKSTYFAAAAALCLASSASAKTSDDQYKVDLNSGKQSTSAQAAKRVQWFKEARFGIFIHWGLYSELAGTYNGHTMPDKTLPHGNSWYSEWAQQRLEVPNAEYQALAKKFNPVKFDAKKWAEEASLAGAKYMVLTSKHHDGFALWDSAVSDYDLGATPCKRDLLKEFSDACRAKGIKVGFYYSHWEDWEHPGGALPPWKDKKQPTDAEFEKYWQEKCLPQVKELLVRYKADLLWFDTWGGVARKMITDKRRDELIDLIRETRPSCLINGRIAAHNPGNRIDFLSAGDNQHPEKNLGRPWQTPGTMCHSWAWHANDFNWKPSSQLIKLLSTNATLGGNYLLNIGPYANGEFPKPAVRRLREIGAWLVANGDAIYGADPMDNITPPKWGRFTTRKKDGKQIVYAHIYGWKNTTLKLPKELGKFTSAKVLETGQPVQLTEDGTAFTRPKGAIDPNTSVIELSR